MTQQEMKDRTRAFALRIIKMVAVLPQGRIGDVLGKQVLKSGTSIGANYREACRASSRKHFITTLEIVQRESDETLYWLDLIALSGIVKPERLTPLTVECGEILSIVTASIVSTKRRT